jgi:PadR family transcriptional regulator, regulatory protein AphA
MKLENLLLGVLLQHPSTGYDLKRYLDTHGRFLRSNTQMSQVYRSLGHMEDRGWITRTVEPRPGAQDAKRYEVTEEGATVFLDWLTSPYVPPSRFEDPDLTARLAFAGFMSVEQVIDLLDTEIETRQNQVARYRHRQRQLVRTPTAPFDEPLADAIGEWMHHKGADAIDAHIANLVELRRQLLDGLLPDRPGADQLKESESRT